MTFDNWIKTNNVELLGDRSDEDYYNLAEIVFRSY